MRVPACLGSGEDPLLGCTLSTPLLHPHVNENRKGEPSLW